MFGLRTKKIYIDSRFRTDSSASNSDFSIELQETLDLPEQCAAYIDDIATCNMAIIVMKILINYMLEN